MVLKKPRPIGKEKNRGMSGISYNRGHLRCKLILLQTNATAICNMQNPALKFELLALLVALRGYHLGAWCIA